jgi:flagellar L-ring protein precursor FlgH
MRYIKLGLLFFTICIPGFGQSLWSGKTTSLYDDPKPREFKKHDLIQVIVLESSSGTVRADLRTDKRTRWESSLDRWVRFDVSAKGNRRLRHLRFPEDETPEIDLDSRFRQDNLGRTVRSSDLKVRITAEIVDILPNGTLVIEAKKSRKINNETETIKLTGKVDPKAVVNNTVMSDKIADLDIVYEGSGAVNDAQKPGLLSWLLGKLWPF